MNRTNVGANTNIGKMFVDMLAVLLGYGVVFATNFFRNRTDVLDVSGSIALLVVIFGAVYCISNYAQSVYDVTLFFYLDRIYRKITFSFAFAFFVTFAELYMSDEVLVDKASYYEFLFATLASIYIITYLYRKFGERFSYKGIPRVVFMGKRGEFNKFTYFLEKTNIRYELVGFVAYSEDTCDGSYLGYVDNLEEIIRDYQIDQVYIMDSHDVDLNLVQNSIDLCIRMGVTARTIVNIYKRRRANSYVSTVGTYPIVTYHTVTLNRSAEIIKRIMDIAGSLVGIVLSSPIMLITALAIKLDSPGPVFFKQTRVGKNGRHFKMYKFRSMCDGADAMKKDLMNQNEVEGGAMFKMKEDPRITKVGKFIRKTSIDELPQFFNILGGTMSLVGTRPPTLDEVEQYDASQWRRISIKPGLTGMWQVSGRSSITDFDEVVKLDTEYIDNWSIFLDISILIKTVLSVFKKDGAY
ncbi:exopolysaccharide biosynthesis polyprenyl glycosylphosphotransferase [Lachnospiraceae bacterium YSD2013]|nr:exopolysaccharide biosynthesis polyprenyl glycosylphosphotransferase [Lachnospiraceae bacterium YSD2013]